MQSNDIELRPINEWIFLTLWVLVHVFILTIGYVKPDWFPITVAVIPMGQWVVLRWAFKLTWPWLILGPITWLYSIFYGPFLGQLFLPRGALAEVESPFVTAYLFLVPGILIGFCNYILFKKRLYRARWLIPVHALALSGAVLIDSFPVSVTWRYVRVLPVQGLVAALFYSVVTGTALIWIRRSSVRQAS
jgi:hypothetical protein